MGVPATDRRFVCLACGWIHLLWAARCSSCLSLKGLTLTTGDSAVSRSPVEDASLPDQDPVVIERELDEMPRPRLMIARQPEPELTDPVNELVDLDDEDSSAPIPISEIADTTFVRDSTGLPPLDHVLGGGLVAASVVLLASPPGIGKSSLALQMLVGLRHRCLYVSGEETKEQVAGTARRIGAVSNRVYVLAEQNLTRIFAQAKKMRAQTIVIDSIQKMRCEDVNGRAGSPAQLKECTARLVDYAKTTDTALWLIGHVTSDGDIQGPKTIEHDVDVVLELTQGAKLEGSERILRSSKNRFGATNVVGRFELTAKGFVSIDADGWDEPL